MRLSEKSVRLPKQKIRAQRNNAGLMALLSILFIAALILIIGSSMAVSGFLEVISGSEDADSKRALTIAETGAEDALSRILKNRFCNEGGVPDCSSYTIGFSEGSSTISVSGINTKTITSEGIVGGRRREVQIIVALSSSNKVTISSWQETNQ